MSIMDNRSLVQKADMAVTDLSTSGGYLQPAFAKEFLDIVIKAGVLMGLATVMPMKSHTQYIDKIYFGSRVLRAGTEGTELPLADRMKPDLAKVILTAKLIKAQTNLSDEVLEDNIEQRALQQHIMRDLGVAAARDLDELFIQGDTTSTDLFLALMDGLIAQTTTHTVNVASAKITKAVFKDMLKTLPSQYLRDRADLRFLTSVQAEIDYRDTLADRATPGGDVWLKENVPVPYAGIPVVAVPMMPENIGTGSVTTDCFLSNPKNFTVGIWREIRFEVERRATAGKTFIVASLRMDAKWANEDATVKAYNIKIS